MNDQRRGRIVILCDSYFRHSRTGTSRRVNWIRSGSVAWMCHRVVVGSINMPAAYAINSIPTHPPRDTAALRGKDNRSTPPSTWTKHECAPRAHTFMVNTSGKTSGLLYVRVCVRARARARACVSVCASSPPQITEHNPLFKIFTPVEKPIDCSPTAHSPTINSTLCRQFYRKSPRYLGITCMKLIEPQFSSSTVIQIRSK